MVKLKGKMKTSVSCLSPVDEHGGNLDECHEEYNMMKGQVDGMQTI